MERTVGVEVLYDQSLFTDGILLENASPGPVEHNFPVKSLMKDCSTLQIKDDWEQSCLPIQKVPCKST